MKGKNKTKQNKTKQRLLAELEALKTECKLAEEGPRESERRFRLMVENSLDYIFQTNEKGKTIYCSPAIERLLGYTPEEREGTDFTSVILPSELERAKTSFNKVTKGEVIQNLEINLLHKSGRTVPVEVTVVPIFKNKEVTSMFGIVRDITERKRAEEALRIKDSAVSSSINAIAISDLEGNLTYVNPSFLRLWGYEDENEVLGISAVEFWQNEEEPLEIIEALRDQGGWVGELVAKTKDGSLFDVQLSASMVNDETGKPICMMGSFVDITEQKKLVAASEQKNIALREMIEQIRIEREQLEDDIVTNVNTVISPLLRKIKTSKTCQKYVDMIQHHLDGLTSSYGSDIIKKTNKLTPRELEISNMVKGGLTSKEISDLLNISLQTVQKHRENIRQKLGISKKKTNLTSFLRGI